MYWALFISNELVLLGFATRFVFCGQTTLLSVRTLCLSLFSAVRHHICAGRLVQVAISGEGVPSSNSDTNDYQVCRTWEDSAERSLCASCVCVTRQRCPCVRDSSMRIEPHTHNKSSMVVIETQPLTHAGRLNHKGARRVAAKSVGQQTVCHDAGLTTRM